MKNFFIVLLFLISVQPSLAQSPTNKLDDLKDRLATKVAELRTVVQKAAYGTVTSITLTGATLDTTTKNLKIEFADDVKIIQIINGKRTILATEDLDKNDVVTVFGSFDETLDLLKASVIFIENSKPIEHVWGTVVEIDAKNFFVTVKTPEDRTVIVDIEKTTKTNQWIKEDGIAKSGFSKITVGDAVHVSGKTNPKADNHLSATRFLDLGKL